VQNSRPCDEGQSKAFGRRAIPRSGFLGVSYAHVKTANEAAHAGLTKLLELLWPGYVADVIQEAIRDIFRLARASASFN